MPEAVKTYMDTKNLIDVEKVHASILTSLQYDFSKYGTRRQQELLKSSLQYVANNIGRKVLIASFPFYKVAKLYYWSREAKSSNAEVDYLLQKENEIYPLEVKAGKTGTLKSMQVYLGEKNKTIGIRLNLDRPNFGKALQAKVMVSKKEKSITYSLLSMPMYFAGYLDKFNF